MASGRFSAKAMSLRAFDLSERGFRAGRRTMRQRVERLGARFFLILQCAAGAGLAWLIAKHVLGHPTPFFAPVAALLVVGVSFGSRMRRAVEVGIGVAVGVAVGDLFVHLFGTGVWQIILVCVVAMSIATLLGAGSLIIIQAGVQSIIVTTLLPDPSYALSRWLDAVVGIVLALLIATIAPSAPLRRPRILAAQVLEDIGGTLERVSKALREDDADAADEVLDRARATDDALQAMREANAEGLGVVRHSPFRRRELPAVQAYADLAVPLDRLSRNLRVLARRAATSTWRGERVPADYVVLIDELAAAIAFMANELWDRRLPVAARSRLIRLGERTAKAKIVQSLSAVVILAQTRSMIVDLMMLTGLEPDEARAAVPGLE
ncbi:FUSC family protein [Propionibacteriaceae bacterium Y1700]|uniref:FUSC family protein n=1 Tax=Microlunatus sp. Y1700 TaxID=3418487 RepID=UPI003DA750EB